MKQRDTGFAESWADIVGALPVVMSDVRAVDKAVPLGRTHMLFSVFLAATMGVTNLVHGYVNHDRFYSWIGVFALTSGAITLAATLYRRRSRISAKGSDRN